MPIFRCDIISKKSQEVIASGISYSKKDSAHKASENLLPRLEKYHFSYKKKIEETGKTLIEWMKEDFRYNPDYIYVIEDIGLGKLVDAIKNSDKKISIDCEGIGISPPLLVQICIYDIYNNRYQMFIFSRTSWEIDRIRRIIEKLLSSTEITKYAYGFGNDRLVLPEVNNLIDIQECAQEDLGKCASLEKCLTKYCKKISIKVGDTGKQFSQWSTFNQITNEAIEYSLADVWAIQTLSNTFSNGDRLLSK